MAARRLILVLVVLLGISIAAAAIAPDRQRTAILGERGETTETTEPETTTTEDSPGPSGEVVRATITADPEKPETVRARPGDQLELRVQTGRPRQVEIEALGLIEDATPDAAAAFNVLLRESGQIAITDAESGEVIGRLVAAPRTPEEREPERRDEKRDRGKPAMPSSAQPV